VAGASRSRAGRVSTSQGKRQIETEDEICGAGSLPQYLRVSPALAEEQVKRLSAKRKLQSKNPKTTNLDR
jgi:hypothetical protein